MADHLREGEERLGHRDVAPERLGELVARAGALGDQAVELLRPPLVKSEALVDERGVVRDRLAVPGQDDLGRQLAGLLQRLEIDDQGLGALCGSIERSRDQRVRGDVLDQVIGCDQDPPLGVPEESVRRAVPGPVLNLEAGSRSSTTRRRAVAG